LKYTVLTPRALEVVELLVDALEVAAFVVAALRLLTGLVPPKRAGQVVAFASA
jgi:hypothetical protein